MKVYLLAFDTVPKIVGHGQGGDDIHNVIVGVELAGELLAFELLIVKHEMNIELLFETLGNILKVCCSKARRPFIHNSTSAAAGGVVRLARAVRTFTSRLSPGFN